MGRQVLPHKCALRPTAAHLVACALGVLGSLSAAVSLMPAASAQTAPAAPAFGTPAAKPRDRLLVEAAELVYDKTHNKVSAIGNVQLYYQGRVLEADRVIYDRVTNRVHAEGNAKLTDENGNITYADRFELTDNFRDGFVDSLTLVTADKTRFTAPRAERINGSTLVLEKGTYTAYLPNKEHPEKPPFWQIKALRIIENTDEHIVYFEDATFELFGMPIAYLPYFSTPDYTVTRKTGFLVPSLTYHKSLGFGASIPFFWNLAPNYDVTITPTFLTRQGFLGDVEWRQRLANGSYSIRATGLHQNDPGVFLNPPYGPGQRESRGSLESKGKFYISDKWTFGWNASAFSDRGYANDYKLKNENITQNYYKEAISSVYLNGQGANGYFDLRGYYIQGLSNKDNQNQLPVVRPVLDYNKLIELPKDKTGGIGGDVIIDANLLSLSRSQAAYQAIGARVLDKAFGLHDVCETNTPDPLNPGRFLPSYNKTSCFLRGLGGDYTRLSAQASWQRKFIDPIGQVWMPFAFVRADVAAVNVDFSRTTLYSSAAGSSLLRNTDQSNFFGSENSFATSSFLPGVGLEYRYPLIARASWGSQIFEPVAQVIARPSERKKRSLPNEDAQSLVFDDTSLFEWNKFSGYDRVEGGTRVNVGAQYTLAMNSGAYANALVGQSYQLTGRNSYSSGDVANAGNNSGLDEVRSDYVGRVSVAPSADLSFTAKGRFDESTLALKRVDLVASAKLGRLSADVLYARYAAQPEIGYPRRREGLYTSAKFALTDYLKVNGTVMFDMARYQYDVAPKNTPRFSPNLFGFGVEYKDEATTFGLNYTSYLNDSSAGNRSRNQSLMFTLQLRTLGDIKGRTSIGNGSGTSSDGITPAQ